MNEFDIIKKYFQSDTIKHPETIHGSGDDCAIIETPSGFQTAISIDTMVENIHFFSDTDPFDLGYKALAINLSDLAACGATPKWFTGALTLPHYNESWLHAFAKGLSTCAKEYQCQLIGGDLTHGPTLTITIQVDGLLPKAQAILRSGAKADDGIYVSGSLGLPSLALKHLQKKLQLDSNDIAAATHALTHPTPMVKLGEALRGIATSMIDISDGLMADLQHILTASNVGAEIDLDTLPIAPPVLKSLSNKDSIVHALSGGDEYKLCFTAPKTKELDALKQSFEITRVGTVIKNNEVILKNNTHGVTLEMLSGYRHF
ncbi:MAG: thiamine-phosphate kinase [Gammaproteobacteria bacterium]